jgi:hypothetical protein
MKKINLLLIVLMGLFTFYSCQKDEEKATVGVFNPPVLIAPNTGSTYTLLEANETDTIAVFVWQTADFGYNAAVFYTLQADFMTKNWKDPASLGSVWNDSIYITVDNLNNALMTLGAFAGEPSQVKFRLKATVSSLVNPVYSDSITATVTPYEKIVIYPSLYLPGTFNGWTFPGTDNIYSVKDDGKYEGFINMEANAGDVEYKFTKVADWIQNQTVADADASGLSGTLVVGDWGNNIIVPTDIGYYLVKADLNAKTYSQTKINSWGVIGTSVPPYDWSADQKMTYDPVLDVWTITLDLKAGELKFRANDAWDINFGDNDANRKLDYGGANIAVAANGNYTVTLDLSGAIYTYKIKQN